MIALNAVLLAFVLQAAPAPQQAPKATISGIVVNSNGEPIPNIRVTLGRMGVSLGMFTQLLIGDHPSRETTISADALTMLRDQMTSEIEGGGVPPEEARRAEAFRALSLDDIQEVTVTPSGSVSVAYKDAPPMMTDERGRFTFVADPGTYKLSFSATSYAKQEYGQRSVSAGGVPLTLAAGETKTDIVMRMLAVGAISGHIRDDAGQPVAGVPVSLLRFAYDATGRRTTQRVTSTMTNDLGEYRMYYLTPGRYYVSAGAPAGSDPNVPDSAFNRGAFNTQNRIQVRYAQTYYPGVAQEGDAVPIEIQSGSELRAVDLVVAPQRTYKVRGRVVDARTGQPPQRVNFILTAQNPDPSGMYSSGIGNTNYKAADGSFELQNVAAGAYVLAASLPGSNSARFVDFDSMSPAEQQEYFRAQQAEDLLRPKASLPLTVTNGDLDGVVLSMGLNGSILGRVRAEGDKAPSLDFLLIQFKNDVPVSMMENGQNSRPVKDDGTFRVDNVRPGEYRIEIAGLTDGFYLKEARVDQTDVLNGTFRYDGGEASGLELLLSPNTGVLEGTTEPGARVVLIPNRNRERTELFRPVTADSAGHFTISAVAPGEYTLAAWDAIEPFAFFEPSLIHKAEEQGQAVRVTESSRQTVTVTTIK